MTRYGRHCRAGLIIALMLGAALFDRGAFGQDAAWEGLINAGRNALQQQNYSEAERHFEAALEAAERFPSGDSRLGKSYNNLAAVYYAQEDYERAEPLMRRALAQLRESLGPKNTEVAQTMKNLAALYYLQGNRSEAEALLKQSLEILEEVHGPNHAFVATVLSNLAGLYQAENRFRDAEPLLTRSLKIWESLLGPEHPDVVRSRELLAKVRAGQGGGPGAPTPAADPRALTAIAETGQAAAAERAEEEEIAKAAEALEDLTEQSKAEADRARAEAAGVPVPPLSPIGQTRVTGINRSPPTPGAEAGDAAGDRERADAGTGGPAPSGIVTSALGTFDAAAQEKATAILDDAARANDVTFSLYLSTLWSVDEARRYWQAMTSAMPEVFRDKQIEIEEVTAEGGPDPFYRVLAAPFASDPEAQAVCDRIKSKLRTHDCSVVARDKATAGG
ncbi:MAG: tetratricopeptide repeat protein [Alphaproteobacteria bacterium]